MAARLEPGVASVSCLGQGPGKALLLIPRLVAFLLKEGVDILHTHNYYTGVYGVPAARLARLRVIHGQHSFNHDARTNEILNRRNEVALCRLASHVSCVSRELEEIVCLDFGTPRRKVTTILNGVDFLAFAPDKERRARTRAGLGIAGGEVLVGSVGRLHYQKNYRLLISVAAELFRHIPGRLLLVGDGPDAQELLELARSQGAMDKIIMAGERKDVSDLMRAMDVFVLPSRFEGLPNVVLEAMCAGLPVIASNVGAIPSLVENGSSGFVFPSGNAGQLSENLERLLEDKGLRTSMGERGRAIAIGSFSIERMVEQYEELYQRVHCS
jgi:glycosyltransferase involved in cell wall biosynthesis